MEIELLVRAVIEDHGSFLIAHATGAGNTYLPGGHVDEGEGLKYALRRELLEELGREVEIGDYLGAVEHAWEDAHGQNHELNHLFEAHSEELVASQSPASREDHIEFTWLAPPEFDEHNLQPAPLRQLLAKWGAGTREIWWASTLIPSNK